MPINLDGIKPRFSVRLSVTNNYPSIEFDFARPPGIEVIREIDALNNHSFVKFIILPNQASYQCGIIGLTPEVDFFEVAEAIAACLENDHGLTVNRVQCTSDAGRFAERTVTKFGA
jgi:hypothetical protein